ncbi:MAG: SRPBCC family protein [Phenylobacterium sp.]
MAEFSVTHSYSASPEQVFDAWLDPAIARRFLFATPTGEMIRAETDPRVGGVFVFVDRRPDMGDVLHTGEYLEIDRPRRLAFTFGVPEFNPDFTRVTLDFAPTAAGGCDLTLTQSDVPAEWAERSKEGWGMILGWLATALG